MGRTAKGDPILGLGGGYLLFWVPYSAGLSAGIYFINFFVSPFTSIGLGLSTGIG